MRNCVRCKRIFWLRHGASGDIVDTVSCEAVRGKTCATRLGLQAACPGMARFDGQCAAGMPQAASGVACSVPCLACRASTRLLHVLLRVPCPAFHLMGQGVFAHNAVCSQRGVTSRHKNGSGPGGAGLTARKSAGAAAHRCPACSFRTNASVGCWPGRSWRAGRPAPAPAPAARGRCRPAIRPHARVAAGRR